MLRAGVREHRGARDRVDGGVDGDYEAHAGEPFEESAEVRETNDGVLPGADRDSTVRVPTRIASAEDDDEDVEMDESDTSDYAKLVRARKQRKKAEKAAAKAEWEEAEAVEIQRAKEQAARRVQIQAYCCAALQNFSAHAAHEKAVRDEGGIGCILAALRAHPVCAPIQLHGESARYSCVALPRCKL